MRRELLPGTSFEYRKSPTAPLLRSAIVTRMPLYRVQQATVRAHRCCAGRFRGACGVTSNDGKLCEQFSVENLCKQTDDGKLRRQTFRRAIGILACLDVPF